MKKRKTKRKALVIGDTSRLLRLARLPPLSSFGFFLFLSTRNSPQQLLHPATLAASMWSFLPTTCTWLCGCCVSADVFPVLAVFCGPIASPHLLFFPCLAGRLLVCSLPPFRNFVGFSGVFLHLWLSLCGWCMHRYLLGVLYTVSRAFHRFPTQFSTFW